MKLNGMFTSIEEAIKHCEEKSFEAGEKGKIECRRELYISIVNIQHRQLADWLIELKEKREKEEIKLPMNYYDWFVRKNPNQSWGITRENKKGYIIIDSDGNESWIED